MIENLHKQIETYVVRFNFLTLSVFICILTLFFSMPPFDSVIVDSTWEAIFQQIKDPFHPIEAPAWSHNSKLTFRLFPVFLGKLLFLNKTGFIVLSYVVGLFIIYLSHKLFFRGLGDKYKAFLLTLSFAFIYAGKMSFLEFRGIFDGLALFMLLLGLYSRNWLVLYFCILFSAFTDERALITSGFIFIYLFSINATFKNKQLVSIVLAWFSYFLLRYLLITIYGFNTSTGGISMSILALNFEYFPISLYSSLEGFWLFIFLFLLNLYKKNRIIFYMHILMILVYLLACYLVIDISRSIAYLSILIFTSISFIQNNQSTFLSTRNCTIILILSFIFPTYIIGGNQITWIKPILFEFMFRFFTNS